MPAPFARLVQALPRLLEVLPVATKCCAAPNKLNRNGCRHAEPTPHLMPACIHLPPMHPCIPQLSPRSARSARPLLARRAALEGHQWLVLGSTPTYTRRPPPSSDSTPCPLRLLRPRGSGPRHRGCCVAGPRGVVDLWMMPFQLHRFHNRMCISSNARSLSPHPHPLPNLSDTGSLTQASPPSSRQLLAAHHMLRPLRRLPYSVHGLVSASFSRQGLASQAQRPWRPTGAAGSASRPGGRSGCCASAPRPYMIYVISYV